MAHPHGPGLCLMARMPCRLGLDEFVVDLARVARARLLVSEAYEGETAAMGKRAPNDSVCQWAS